MRSRNQFSLVEENNGYSFGVIEFGNQNLSRKNNFCFKKLYFFAFVFLIRVLAVLRDQAKNALFKGAETTTYPPLLQFFA
jgi:hypothetical protein